MFTNVFYFITAESQTPGKYAAIQRKSGFQWKLKCLQVSLMTGVI